MLLSQQFRQKAAYCSSVASTAEYHDKRTRFVEEARKWSRLAAEAARQEVGAVPSVPDMEPARERRQLASPQPHQRRHRQRRQKEAA
jgi:hypothetical protein